MIAKTSFMLSLFFAVLSFQVLAAGLWSNSADGFGAKFPQTPERVGAATSTGSGYAYQSSKSFSNGGALYAITVVPIPPNIAKEKPTEFLEASNAAFVKSMGQNPSSAKVKWARFVDDRKRLNYEFEFVYSGVPFKGYGFWIIDKNRAIRVSVSYTKSLSRNEVRETISFLDSFVILTKHKK